MPVILPGKAQWAFEFARLLKQARNKTTFTIDLRADGVEPDLIAELKEAGLRSAFIGVENGGDEGLKLLRKGYKSAAPR